MRQYPTLHVLYSYLSLASSKAELRQWLACEQFILESEVKEQWETGKGGKEIRGHIIKLVVCGQLGVNSQSQN